MASEKWPSIQTFSLVGDKEHSQLVLTLSPYVGISFPILDFLVLLKLLCHTAPGQPHCCNPTVPGGIEGF